MPSFDVSRACSIPMRLALLGVGLLAGGCLSAPRPPAPALPSAWHAAPTADAAVTADGWIEQLACPPLTEAVRAALAGSPTLEAALARLDQAAAEVGVVTAEAWPQVQGEAGGSRSRTAGQSDGPFATDPRTRTQWTLGARASWELDLWGRVRAARRAGAATMDAALADLASARRSVAGRTAQAWVAAVEAEAAAVLAARAAEAATAVHKLYLARYARGTAEAAAVHAAQADAAAALATQAQRRATARRAALALQRLIGDATALDGQGPALPTLLPAEAPELGAGLPVDLIERRADVAAAAARLEVALAGGDEARRARLPRLALTASYGVADDSLSDLLRADNVLWTIGGNLVQPLFDGGRLRAQVDLADARSRGAAAAYADLVLQALMEVEAALGERRYARERLAAAQQAAQSQTAAVRDLERRFTTGLADAVIVLAARRRGDELVLAALAAQAAAIQLHIEAALALGLEPFSPAAPPKDSP